VRSQRSTLLIGLLGLLVLGGCTVQSQGSPRPTRGSTDTSTTEQSPSSIEETPGGTNLPNHGAPNVENPLDITKFLRDPCKALTAEQAAELNVPTTGAGSANTLGQVCEWKNPDTRGFVNIEMREKNASGLSALYAADKNGKYPFFDVLPPIEGYPAVAYDVTDERDRGICAVSVGVANDLSFAVGLELSPANIGTKDPCETAASVAGMMMKTMKEAS
jgi:hypothetical protein